MSSLTKIEPKKLAQGQTMKAQDRLEILLDIREWLDEGYISTTKIAAKYGVTKATASRLRKDALILIEKDDNGFNRDALRHIQVGRILHKIEGLETELPNADNVRDRMTIHKVIQGYYDSIARITGLNSETIDHTVQMKPLNIVMPSIEATTPIDTTVIEVSTTDTDA